MLKIFDRYIFSKLLTITLFVLVVLIFIFVMIDFSENSDDFTDQGATMAEIWGDYYLNYIPEMIRLVLPVAVFTSCLFLTGQLSERLEITALKAAGVSLYRLCLPYLIFAITIAVTISYLDANIIPLANRSKIAFEKEYIKRKSEKIDSNDIYRQLSDSSVIRINYFDKNANIAYRIWLLTYDGNQIRESLTANKMIWNDSTQNWSFNYVIKREFSESGYKESDINSLDSALNIYPRDLSRTTSDIYQLTYSEANDYINSILRSGAGSVNIPLVQFYGRIAYPLSLIVVILLGFAVASVRRRGGKGLYISAGLTISFLYLAFMKISEPFGYYGTLTPLAAAALPHLFFFVVGVFLLIQAKK